MCTISTCAYCLLEVLHFARPHVIQTVGCSTARNSFTLWKPAPVQSPTHSCHTSAGWEFKARRCSSVYPAACHAGGGHAALRGAISPISRAPSCRWWPGSRLAQRLLRGMLLLMSCQHQGTCLLVCLHDSENCVACGSFCQDLYRDFAKATTCGAGINARRAYRVLCVLYIASLMQHTHSDRARPASILTGKFLSLLLR